ncbi:Uroporphyrinogen-III synthase [Saezia sanguinis]|uniref:Uroporphyrinogen-III synthase n=1 Tax=Saezia sanguinis TaxID=1965230 RepID=A0A433SEN4_9BURK|nr:uroporphyrinogen-III synthase [Saezia sanguinis]RUS67185.1 Uroporphyrinogen-III synthase [Saezia sanguinis]
MKTVIVTRPLHQAQPWIEGLQQHGFSVRHIPLLSIQAVADNQPLHHAWAQIDQYTWVMFVSANAVHYFFKGTQHVHWPSHLRAGATGNGTTKALTASGVAAHLIDQPAENQPEDTEHLWQQIADRHWSGTQVLLVRGRSAGNRPERNWLMHQLQHAGAQVQCLAVYQRCAPVFSADDLLWLGSHDARNSCWIFSSSEAIEYLPDYDWAQTTAIVTHQRIAQAAHKAGFGHVVCTRPDLLSLVDSVKSVV